MKKPKRKTINKSARYIDIAEDRSYNYCWNKFNAYHNQEIAKLEEENKKLKEGKLNADDIEIFLRNSKWVVYLDNKNCRELAQAIVEEALEL